MLLSTLSYKEGQVLRHFYKMAPFWTVDIPIPSPCVRPPPPPKTNILRYTLLSEVRILSPVRMLILKSIRKQFWGYQIGHGTNFFHSSKVRVKLSLCFWMFYDGCEMRLWLHVTTFLVRRKRNGSLTFPSGKTKTKISVTSMQMF